jgi:hypothetical protein
MLVDEQKLRWCGIDLRARWRRRVAVVLTYAAFVGVVWSPWRNAYGLAISVMWISLLVPLVDVSKDVGVWMRWAVRTIFVLIVVCYVYRSWEEWLRPRRVDAWDAWFVPIIALIMLLGRSVLTPRRLVEGGHRGWMAEAIRNSGDLNWRQQRRLARNGYGVGLDGFAWYEYNERFHRLTGEQKLEIESLQRAHPRGKWMRQRDGVLFDDERIRDEEARVRARVQKAMSWVLVGAALVLSVTLMGRATVKTDRVLAGLWTLAGLVTTLGQAIPLWIEDDPRVVAGEMAVVADVRV